MFFWLLKFFKFLHQNCIQSVAKFNVGDETIFRSEIFPQNKTTTTTATSSPCQTTKVLELWHSNERNIISLRSVQTHTHTHAHTGCCRGICIISTIKNTFHFSFENVLFHTIKIAFRLIRANSGGPAGVRASKSFGQPNHRKKWWFY